MAYIGIELSPALSAAVLQRRGARGHITLAHIGKITYEDAKKLAHGLELIAATTAPMSWTQVLRYEAWHAEGGTIAVAPLDRQPDLVSLRERVQALLLAAKVSWSNDYPRWIPHVTCGKEIVVGNGPRSVQMELTEVSLIGGPLIQHYAYPLSG